MSRTIRCDYRDERNFLCEERVSTDSWEIDMFEFASARGWTFPSLEIDLCPEHSLDVYPIPKRGKPQ